MQFVNLCSLGRDAAAGSFRDAGAGAVRFPSAPSYDSGAGAVVI